MDFDEAKRIILVYHFLSILDDTDLLTDFEAGSVKKAVSDILKELKRLDAGEYLEKLIETLKMEMERR